MTYIDFLFYCDPLFGVNVANRSRWHGFVTGDFLVLPEEKISENNTEKKKVTEPITVEPLNF